MSLSKNQLKLITSLGQKKYRQKHKLFVAEGIKVVREFLQSTFELHSLFTTNYSFEGVTHEKVFEISTADLHKISNLKTPNKVLALFHIPEEVDFSNSNLYVALDAVNDPGNLGTIIRLCDWFGIEHLLCSKETVDCFNSKVVQASMGSLTRVSIHYVDLIPTFLKIQKLIFIADMDGENVYTSELPSEGILVLGNEANGVSIEIKNAANRVVSIPRFGSLKETESLNVATATAVLLSEFKRRA